MAIRGAGIFARPAVSYLIALLKAHSPEGMGNVEIYLTSLS